MKDKRPQLKKYLLDHINSTEGWIPKVSLYIVGDQIEFSPESVGRTCRTLFKEGKIQRELYQGKWVKNLCKYASLKTEKPIIRKATIVEINGERVVYL